MGAVMALIASTGWGISEFIGGVSSRAKSVLVVLAVSQATGLALVLAVYGLHGTMPLVQGAAPWAIGAGAASAATLGLLYLALAQGDVVVVAPLASAEIIVPVAVGLATGVPVTAGIWAGLALAIAGLIAASWSPAGESGDEAEPGGPSRPGRSRKLKAAALALAASGCAGLFLVLLSHASMGDPFAATSVVHVTSFAVAVIALTGAAAWRLSRKRPRAAASGPGGFTIRGWLAVAACGLGDAVADICYASASMGNQVVLAAVVTSLYPVVTMVLAMIFLRERPGLVQGAGAVAVLAGVFVLTLASAPMTHMMAHMPPVAASP